MLGCALVGPALTGCARAVQVPAAPPLPEVRFIPPEDPQAVIALSSENEVHLKERDRLLRERIRILEGLLTQP